MRPPTGWPSACTAAARIAVPMLLMASAHAQQASSGATIAARGTAQGVPACIACHGAHGQGNAAAGFPRLAGTGAAYLDAQLAAFAAGTRASPVMQPIAKLMTADVRGAVARYYSQLSAPPGIRSADDPYIDPSDTGAWLATRGRWEQGLPACAQCHGPGGAGVGASFPPLAGQSAAYIEAQLHAWQKGTRPPGPLGLMRVVASKLSDADIAAVANYYASAGKPETGAAK